MELFFQSFGYLAATIFALAWVAPKMLAWAFLLIDASFDRVSRAMGDIEDRREAKKKERRRQYLMTVDVAELRKSRDLADIIEARQAEIVQAAAKG